MISKAVELFKKKPFILLQAATGAGKTIFFSILIQRLLKEFPHLRICVLVHREILVRQNAEKMLGVWPEAPIGIACSSASKDVDVRAPVVFGSVQTLANRVGEIPPFHLVIIDECHRLPPKTIDSQYKTFLDAMLSYYPSLRVLGLTASPWRLNHGPIYGKNHKRKSDSECGNWFDELDYELSIRDLQKIDPEDSQSPYLVSMRVWVEDRGLSLELERVKTTAGEFNQADLSELMRGGKHVATAVEKYLEYRGKFGHRSRCAVFAVDISHAEELVLAFQERGIGCDCVHSRLGKMENAAALEAFDEGKLPVIVNVGVLTEGWDCRATDMLLMARPTLSPALFVQMVGRGLRTFPGKGDCLILDLAGNFDRHGPPWSPNLPDYSKPGKAREKRQQPEKKCPECGFENSPNVWNCQECGAILRVKEDLQAKAVALRELDLNRAEAVVSPGVDAVPIDFKLSNYVPRNGVPCLRFDALLQDYHGNKHQVSHFFRFQGSGSTYARIWWRSIAGEPVPTTIDEAIANQSMIRAGLPKMLKISKQGEYWKVLGW